MIEIREIIEYLEYLGIKYEYVGDRGAEIVGACSIDNPREKNITWVRYIEDLNIDELGKVRGLILFAELSEEFNSSVNIMYVDNVHDTFFMIVDYFFKENNYNIKYKCIEKTAVVETRRIGENAYIGHHTFIGENVEIGENARIFHNVTIQGRVKIGNNVTIESGTSIGIEGFGHYLDLNGTRQRAPHIAGVSIGDNVRIGSNTVIARGCLEDTIIENNVVIDNMCYISHNDIIKTGAAIVAGTTIGGSTIIGENVWCGLGSSIADQITIGRDTYIGMGSTIIKEVPEKKVMAGNAARIIRDNEETVKIHRRKGRGIENE